MRDPQLQQSLSDEACRLSSLRCWFSFEDWLKIDDAAFNGITVSLKGQNRVRLDYGAFCMQTLFMEIDGENYPIPIVHKNVPLSFEEDRVTRYAPLDADILQRVFNAAQKVGNTTKKAVARNAESCVTMDGADLTQDAGSQEVFAGQPLLNPKFNYRLRMVVWAWPYKEAKGDELVLKPTLKVLALAIPEKPKA
jgi:hypothetical protein